MLEELFNLVKGAASQSVVNNPEVPDEHNDAVIAEATNTVASGLRNMVAGGGLQNILSLFNHNQQNSQQQSSSAGLLNNPIVNMMVGHFTEKLMSKFKLGGTQANGIANNLIPSVLSSLVNKTNDSGNSGFSLEGILNSITGGKATQAVHGSQEGSGGLDIGSLISQFTGGGQQGSGGGGGLMNIVSQLASGAQEQQQQNGGGGLMNLIQGFMKK